VNRTRLAAAVAGCALAVLPVACGGAVVPADLSGTWPGKAAPYEQATKSWTRVGSLRTSWSEMPQQIMELRATVKAPPWRAAYVDFVAEKRKLGKAARKEFAAEQRKLAAEKLEVELFVATHDRRMNDLQKEDRGSWEIVLIGADGVVHKPVDIRRDRRPRTEIQSEFPGYSDFAVAYVASFEKPDLIFKEGLDRLVLRMSSSQGGVELEWRN